MPSTARLYPGSAGFSTTVLILLLAGLQLTTSGEAQTLPDLAITNVQVNPACQMVVTMQNLGGPLPAGASPTLQSYTGTGAAAGGWTMDASKLGPGGTLQWVRQGPLVSGTETYKLVVSPGSGVTDAQPNNNTVVQTLSCAPKLPDLQIAAIEFTPDCRTKVRLLNGGDIAVEDVVLMSGYGARLERTLDGRLAGWVWLGAVDPSKRLKPVGGTVEWTDGAEYRAAAKVKYQLRDVRQEKDTANNVREVAVPPACAAQPAQTSLPDLAITNVQVNAACQMVVTMQNLGGPLPAGASPTLQSYTGTGAAAGGWTMDASKLGPGGTLQWVRQGPLVSGTETYKLVVSPGSGVTDAQPNNNTVVQTLSCAAKLPDLQIAAIEFTPDCRTKVRLQNGGDAALEDVVLMSGYGARLERTLDGRVAGWVWLGAVDPSKRLKPVGGTVEWMDGAEYRATAKVKYQLRDVRQEKDTANNAREVAVPAACAPQPPTRSISPPSRVPSRSPVPPSPKTP